jgi:uncharacterized OB-fold protein
MSELTRPVVVPDEESRPFFEGALRSELMLLRCTDCGTFMFPTSGFGTPVRTRCVGCFSPAVEWAASSGRGTLYSFVLMHIVYDEAFADRMPYNIASVMLDEGVRFVTTIVDCENDELEIDAPVEVAFERQSDDVAIPVFRLVR